MFENSTYVARGFVSLQDHSALNCTPSPNLNLALTPTLLLVNPKLWVTTKPGLQSNAIVKGKSNEY